MRMRGSIRLLLLCLVAGIGVFLISWALKDNNFIMVDDARHPKIAAPVMRPFRAIAGDFDANKDAMHEMMFTKSKQNIWNPIAESMKESDEMLKSPTLDNKLENIPLINGKKMDSFDKPQNYFVSDTNNHKVIDDQKARKNFPWGHFESNQIQNNKIPNLLNTQTEHIQKVNEWSNINQEVVRQGNKNGQGPSWQNEGQGFQTSITPKQIIVHLDLKGSPPKLAYLKQFIPFVRSLGATGLLMEYEDMFPYSGPLKKLSAKNAYTPKDIALINQLAADNGMLVIPLIQTFGHLEFLLKLKEFKHLREVYKYPQSICPTNNQTFPILHGIVDQIMQLHPNIKWLHIGCDEVYNIGECTKCVKRMDAEGLDANGLYVHHVVKIANYVKLKYNVQPIIWDDMLREMPFEVLQASNLGKIVQPMVWNYAPYVPEVLPFNVWDKYSQIFPKIWAASAFKGATGPSQYITNIRHHLDNHLSWLSIWNNEHAKFETFYGFAITGWQRFDHFAILCELLPVGLPSLTINLLTLKYGFFNNDILIKASRALNYTNNHLINLDITLDTTDEVPSCFFPGSNIFKGIKMYHSYRQSYDSSLKNPHLIGWMSDYNVKRNFSSPAHIEIGQKEYSRLIQNLTSLRTYMMDALREVYDEYTVKEWIESFITPVLIDLKRLLAQGKKLISVESWPRRPV